MRPRLLFVYLNPSTFVQDDLEMLAGAYDVRVFRAGERRGPVGLAGTFFRQLFWLIRELPRAGVVFGWFADYHMALPVLLARWFHRPVAVVLGGFDANHLPELGYGVFESRWRAPLARFVLRNASILLPVAEALIESENRYAAWPEVRRNGVRAHVPDLRTRFEVVPTGFEPEAWPPGPADRPPVVGTVAFLDGPRTDRVKGLDLFIEAARQVPGASFEVVGVPEAERVRIEAAYNPPENVRLLPPRPRSALPAFYAGVSVYAQLSRTEGLPNVLCEAMLCGCIPVGSRAGGIPDAIGDTGFVLDAPEPDRIAPAIRRALALGPEARLRARARIVERFSRNRRRAALHRLLAGMSQAGRGGLPPER